MNIHKTMAEWKKGDQRKVGVVEYSKGGSQKEEKEGETRKKAERGQSIREVKRMRKCRLNKKYSQS